MSTLARSELDLPLVVTSLLTGPVHRDRDAGVWRHLSGLAAQVGDYMRVMGLDVVIDEAEGYAFLRSLPDDETENRRRLIARRTLPYQVSLLLALLRKRLTEHDASSEDPRLVLPLDDLVRMIEVYLPSSVSEAARVDQAKTTVRKVAELGYLRKLGDGTEYEVERILKAFVTAEWLAEFERKLTQLNGGDDASATTQDDPIYPDDSDD